MGHRALSDVTKVSDKEIVEWLNATQPAGGRLLGIVDTAIAGRAMLVAIASPFEWLPHRHIRGAFANLVVDPEKWRDVVSSLIPAAQLIVVHRADASAGLDYELKAIRAAGCERKTIVVREPELPSAPTPEAQEWWPIKEAKREELRRAARTAGSAFPPDSALAPFFVLEWRDDAALSIQVSAAIDELLNTDARRRFGQLPSLSPEWASPEDQARHLTDAREGYEMAARCVNAGDLDLAEELLFECIATSSLADNVGGRASAYLELGRLFVLRVDRAREAATLLGYASGHFMILKARELALESLHLYASALALCKVLVTARSTIENAESLENTNKDRAWQRELWTRIRFRTDDADVMSFVQGVLYRIGVDAMDSTS